MPTVMSTITYPAYATSTGLCPRLPLRDRHNPISYVSEDGSTGATAYPINYDELYNLKGRLLTIVDATFTDPQQRKAHKDIIWQTLQAWMSDVESAARGLSEPKSDGSTE